MFLNHLKTAYRNLLRNKGFALINVSGLAIGIASCLLLFLVIQYELSFDTFRSSYDRIFHIYTQDKTSDGISYNPGIPFPALEAIRTDFPQLKSGAVCTTYGNQVTVSESSGPGRKFIEPMGTVFADPEFMEIIRFNWLAGNTSVLKEPYTVVLNKSNAEKYFGSWQQAMGKTIKLDNSLDLRVAGIVEDAPYNSDFAFSMIGSFITLKNTHLYGYTTDWGSTTSNFQIYLLFPETITEAAVEDQLLAFSNKYYKNKGSNVRTNLLRPLKDIHFDTTLGNTGTHVMPRSALLALSFIGFLIIVMACINFINLSTAQAVNRSKEVGIRKVLGSNRKQLFWQMLGETNLIVLAASLLAIVIAWVMIPYLKHVVTLDKDLALFTRQSLLFLLATIVITSVLAGVYPAMVLSGFSPVMALKNKITTARTGGIYLRRSLVVLQFAISQALIIGTIVAVSQMNFVRSADLGFNKDAILLVQGSNDSTSLASQPAFKQELLKIAGISAVSFASDMPSSDNNSGTNFAFDHKPDEDYTLYLKFGDEDYFKTFGLQFLAGTPYSKSDTATQVVINETLLKKLGMRNAEEAIGKEMRTGGSRFRKICGVVKDFKTNSLREEVKPIMISSRRQWYQITCIKLHTQNLAKTQAEVQKTWESFFPDYVYISNFMEETIERFYQQETQMALLYKIFAGLAIFISCLGLYGLVSFMVVQKTKEVGIRKVLGAGIPNILYLFSKEFTWLICLAFVIAAPLAYYFMNAWLDNFAFRIHMGIGVFLLGMCLSLAVALLAVSYKAIKAALANPVKSLRTE